MIQPENGIAPPAPDEPTRTDSDTSELTDTDNSAAANQTQAEKRWADLFKKAEAEKPVIEDKTKYVVFAPHILAIMKTLEDMKKQLVKLTTTCEEQQVVIANQSDMLREIHSKLTVANTGVEENKAPDSDLHPLQLDADAKKQALVSQEIADINSRIITADESLAKELQRQEFQTPANVEKKVSFQTPKLKEREVTARDASTFFSGEKSSLNDKNN